MRIASRGAAGISARGRPPRGRLEAVQGRRAATDDPGVNASTPDATPAVVLLCGGLGTRMREETEYRPKPMVEVGGRPLLWHIMKLYAEHGLTRFVCCLGYRG